MPVVEKIEKIGETKKMYGKVINITTTYISIDKGVKLSDTFERSNNKFIIDLKHHSNKKLSKLEATYKVVTEFINWYEKNKESSK